MNDRLTLLHLSRVAYSAKEHVRLQLLILHDRPAILLTLPWFHPWQRPSPRWSRRVQIWQFRRHVTVVAALRPPFRTFVSTPTTVKTETTTCTTS
jgi:hypothetical protein